MSAALIGGVVTGAGHRCRPMGAAAPPRAQCAAGFRRPLPGSAAGLAVEPHSSRTAPTSHRWSSWARCPGSAWASPKAPCLATPSACSVGAPSTAALWAVGWTATTAGGISVDNQFVVFGSYRAIASVFLQSIIIGPFIPAKAVQS